MKKKLNLKDLEVKSFVTTVDRSEIKGGAQIPTLKNGCEVSDLAFSACRTCGIVCYENQ